MAIRDYALRNEALVLRVLASSSDARHRPIAAYFISVGDAPQKTSLEYFEYKTGKKATVLKIGKPFWFGMALSPDQRSILYSTIDSAGSNLMLVNTFR